MDEAPYAGPPPVIAMGGACVLFDAEGRVLLVRHTYGRLNWEIPGGGAEPGESPDETAIREIREETGLEVEVERLTGVYYEADPRPGSGQGPLLHFVFVRPKAERRRTRSVVAGDRRARRGGRSKPCRHRSRTSRNAGFGTRSRAGR